MRQAAELIIPTWLDAPGLITGTPAYSPGGFTIRRVIPTRLIPHLIVLPSIESPMTVMNQHQPQDYQPGQGRQMVERIRNLLNRQTSDLHYWLANPDDLPTLRLIWCHYRDCWSSLTDQ